MRFYKLSNNTNYTKSWAYAYKIHPKSEEVIHNCAKCGAVGRYPKGEFDVDVEGGSKYPDVLQCGAYPLLIVSENVLKDWEKNNIRGFEKFKVGIANVSHHKLKEITPPQYYHIVVNGRCEVDLDAMGVKIVNQCSVCDHKKFEPQIGFKHIIIEKTWDGSDIFVSNYFPRVYFCTQKIFDIAGENCRTNFRFSYPEEVEKWGEKGIDYLSLAKRNKKHPELILPGTD